MPEPGRQGDVGAELARRLAASTSGSGPKWLGSRSWSWAVVSLASVGSTNDVARALAMAGAGEGTVVVADTQTSGRGRLGRAWHSPPGSGLWCSAILRPATALGGLGPLGLVIALAVHRAAVRLGAVDVRVKWPNDIVARGRKVAGILTEAAGGSERTPPEFVIAGIGVNVITPAGGFPEPLREVAVALDELGVPAGTTAAGFGACLLAQLADVYAGFLAGGFAALRAEWLRSSVTIGQHVTVSGVSTTVEGLAEDVDAHGRVVVRVADGSLVPIASGDVTLRPPVSGTCA